MNTKNIDQDAFLTLFLTREPSLPEIAKQLGVSIATLVAYIKSPEIKQLLADIEQITHDRNRLLAAEAMLETVAELRELSPLPENPTPADQDRRRKTIDVTRRAAELILKLSLNSPAPARRAPRSTEPAARHAA
jgi:DNA-binding MarR family transcriptional regulator